MRYKDGVIERMTVWRGGVRVDISMSKMATLALSVADSLSMELFGRGVVVTSVLDGRHMVGSKHYEGNAFDLRTWIYSDSEVSVFVRELQRALGVDYDVIKEVDHIHVEYDQGS